jgi:hypothetical protein
MQALTEEERSASALCAVDKAISQHFCHYYHKDCAGLRAGQRGCWKCQTDKPDWSCQKCRNMDYPLRRRFNLVPKHLKEIIEKEVLQCLSNNLLEPSDVAEKIIHMWMDTSVKIRESVSRRRYQENAFIKAFKPGGHAKLELMSLNEDTLKYYNARH